MKKMTAGLLGLVFALSLAAAPSRSADDCCKSGNSCCKGTTCCRR